MDFKEILTYSLRSKHFTFKQKELKTHPEAVYFFSSASAPYKIHHTLPKWPVHTVRTDTGFVLLIPWP